MQSSHARWYHTIIDFALATITPVVFSAACNQAMQGGRVVRLDTYLIAQVYKLITRCRNKPMKEHQLVPMKLNDHIEL